MRQSLRSSLVLAAVVAAFACSGSFTSGANGPIDPGTGPGATGSGTTGDGGLDGGDGGLFTTGDAGNHTCNGLPPTMNVVDSCANSSVVTLITPSQTGCDVTLTFGTATSPCTGTLNGPNDAFDGGCVNSSNCTSATLPGAITCVLPLGGTCQIHVCNVAAGTCP